MPAAQHGDALVALDKLDKIGVDGVADEFGARGIARGDRRAVPAAVRGAGRRSAPAETVRRLERACSAEDDRAVANLRDDRHAGGDDRRGQQASRRSSLARGLSYYTGAIMEIAVPDLAGQPRRRRPVRQPRSGMFLGRDVPACGFSLGLERIIVVMTERDMFPATVVARRAST